MSDCIFCMIANKEIESEIVYEDDKIAVFKDAGPVAPVHVLMVPKKHIDGIQFVTDEDAELLSHMMLKIKDIADLCGLENGYRVVINSGEDGQQTVQHLHIHIIGQRELTWPPG